MTPSEAPIEIVAYDPAWPVKFDEEAAVLRRVLAPWLVGPIEHIGSTAVPGLAAKAVIDIMAPVASLQGSLAAVEAAQSLGYCHFPYKPEQMHWFCKPSPSHRTHHLHLVPYDSSLWLERLAFREALRANPALAGEYAALKRRLAVRHRDDREAYTEGKSDFVAAVLQQWDAASHPRIVVLPHDPRWPIEFERAAGEAVTALGPSLLSIHHIGSTSIPGIHARPVIDLLAVVADLAAVDRRSAAMERLGYEVKGEFGIEGRRYFRRDDSTGRWTHQVHAFAEGSPEVRRHLAFRDFLRAHPTLAGRYGELKRTLAEAHPYDMQAYMDGKDGFIKEMESRALTWLASSGGGPSTA